MIWVPRSFSRRTTKRSWMRSVAAWSRWIRERLCETTRTALTCFNVYMAVWTNVKRIARYGFIGFIRNGFVSLAAVFILIIALFFLANLMISNAAMTATLEELTEKVGITVYFQPAAPEEQVMTLKQSLEALPESAAVTYTSRDQALANFPQR